MCNPTAAMHGIIVRYCVEGSIGGDAFDWALVRVIVFAAQRVPTPRPKERKYCSD